MSSPLHFAKIFGTCWAIMMVVYIAVIYRWGFGFSVGFIGRPHPPMWVVQTLFWTWPVAPAFFIAMIWELIRVAVLRRA